MEQNIIDPPTGGAGIPAAEDLRALIAGQPFFKGLGPRQIGKLAASAMQVQFEAGEVIFKTGDPANRFYLILEGKVVLESEGQDCQIIPVSTLGAGDNLGWSWLFPPFYLHLGARAMEPTKAIFFYGTRLREECEADHELGYQLMKRIAEAMIQSHEAVQQHLGKRVNAAEPAIGEDHETGNFGGVP